MSEKRYSIKTAAEFLNLTPGATQYRAKMLEIQTTYGLTAEDIGRIAHYIGDPRGRRKRAELSELQKEMEALSHE